jgi:hypothetical protein
MTWYIADIVRGTYVNDSRDKKRLADRLFCLVEAPDAEAAYQKALELVESSQCDETYTDEDGTSVEMRAMGLRDLREIVAPAPADGVALYSESLSGDPALEITEKEQLTVFVPPEAPNSDADADANTPDGDENAPDPRFSDRTPIR